MEEDESRVQAVRSRPVSSREADSDCILRHDDQGSISALSNSISRDISICHMIGYGTGHFYNDLCASMWFTYLMIFLEKVLNFRSSLAGLLMLIGQVTDAVCTPFVGMASDASLLPSCMQRFGRRISWHAIGTFFVTISFPFIFNKCLLCRDGGSEWWEFAWFVPFIMLFQFGWAAVQISHLALIPELSQNDSCRTTLNSLRYSFTVLANLAVFAVLAAFLNSDDSGGGVTPSDRTHFASSAWIVVGAGLVATIIFFITTREPTTGRRMSRLNSFSSEASELVKMSWTNWLAHYQFYQIAFLYMFSRLYINISQVYFPFYITLTQNYSKKYVAVLPMVSYITSFVISFLTSASFINRYFNRKLMYMFGCLIGIGNCVWMLFGLSQAMIYIVAALLGVAQSILLVTSLAVTADLINKNTESGAFVYGAMSFVDKLANGVAYQIIELLNPRCIVNEPHQVCSQFYRDVMVYVPGGCLVLGILVLITLLPHNVGKRNRRTRAVDESEDDETFLVQNEVVPDGHHIIEGAGDSVDAVIHC